MSNTVQNLRDISSRYARSGSQNDVDEFQQEMNRIEQKQRYQTLERYINDIYRDYPYLVRNRYYQFVPIRNQRLTQLVQLAIAQQQALINAQQSAANVAAAQQAAAQQAAAADVAAAEDTTIPTVSSLWANAMPYVMIALAVLIVLILVSFLVAMYQMMKNMTQQRVVVQRSQEPIVVN